jgi:cell wall-associated NlpC family hydrolase
MRVAVAVATLWVSPDSPRVVDGLAVRDDPDVEGWLAELDRHEEDDESGGGRRGLHGRVQTQLTAGEPVLVLGANDAYPGWASVVCPWQPSSLDPRGYPGWLRRSHLVEDAWDVDQPSADPSLPQRLNSDGRADLALARRHLGLPYLWGGTSAYGLDCSGLVHLVHRELGRVLPRDAHDQHAACQPVPVDEAEAGDLYFFARPGRPGHHVGMVTAPGRMLHAAEGRCVVEEDLTADRLAALTAAGRPGGRSALTKETR